MIVRPDGTDRRQLTHHYSLFPVLSPDGQRVALYQCGPAGCGTYVGTVAGPFTNRIVADYAPSDWQPRPA